MKILKRKKNYKLVILQKQIYKLNKIADVIYFKSKNILTDDDINYLFLGLINLVKKNAIERVENMYKKELTKSLIKIDENNKKISALEKIILEKNKVINKLIK